MDRFATCANSTLQIGFFEGIVKSSKTIRQISRMIFKVAPKQFCMNKTDGEQP